MSVLQRARLASIAILAACGFSLLLAAAGLKPLTTADLHKLRYVADVQLSPDGSQVAYTVMSSDQPGTPYPRIWIADAATGESRPLSSENGTAHNPRWSPDGKSIAYLGWQGTRSGLFVARADGSAIRHVAEVSDTNDPTPSMGEPLSWSPDSREVAFVSATAGPEPPPTGDPVVITRYLYKPYASDPREPFNDNRRLHVFIANVTTTAVRQLTTGTCSEHSIDWSPKGDEILFVSNRERDPDRMFNYDIFAARASDGRVRRLSATRSAEYDPRWSPDGARIAFLATTRPLTSSETTMEDTHVWVMNADGSARTQVGLEDNRQGAPAWNGAGAVTYTIQRRGVSQLVKSCVGTACDATIAGSADSSVGAFSVTPGGVGYALSTGTRPAELVLGSGAGARALTHLNDRLLGDRGIAGVESFTFKSFDGLPVQAFITRPLAFERGKKYPLVVVMHGGPHGQQGPTFNAKAQIYAGAGFASLMVNYRGSTGYGQKFADAIFGDQDGGEAKDVLGGVSAAIAKYPWIDRNALFIEGGSYGGQLTNWIVTQTDRFRAAVSLAGISNLVSFNYMAYYHDYLAVEYGGYPHERGIVDRLWERSPIRYAKDAHTPVMFIHGEHDNDVPIAEAEQFYIALKDVGVEAVMVRYPREGHGLRETRHVADAIDRSLAWYRSHMPEPTPSR